MQRWTDDPPPRPLTRAQQEYAVTTWRYLRLAMIVLVVGLFTAVFYEAAGHGFDCVQTSISAYYYTHAQAIFVGGLIAIGACLVCLRGSTEIEDILLNLAGMLAAVVALVPTPDAGPCATLRGLGDPTPNVENNITALLVMGFAGFAVLAALSWRHPPVKKAPLIGFGAAVSLWAVALGLFLSARSWVVDNAHLCAAVLMFICMIAVACLNAISFKAKQGDPDAHNRYSGLAVVMVGSVIALLVLGGEYKVLLTELDAIGLFAVFWVIQTEELWRDGLRPQPATPEPADDPTPPRPPPPPAPAHAPAPR